MLVACSEHWAWPICSGCQKNELLVLRSFGRFNLHLLERTLVCIELKDREATQKKCPCQTGVARDRTRKILVTRKTPGFCAEAIPGDGTFLNS